MKRFLKYDTEITKKENSPVDKNGLIKENIVGGGSRIQPDWNQNDEAAADYVKNRPFYTGDPVETVLLEETSVTLQSYYGLYMGSISGVDFNFELGATYKVSWGGTEYTCVCFDNNGYYSIGNVAISGSEPDTGEPFFMGMQNGGISIIATNEGTYTVSIAGYVPEIIPIAPKYLPTPLIIDATHLPTDNSGWGELYENIDSAYKDGIEILLDVYSDDSSILPCVSWRSCIATFIYAKNDSTLCVYILTALPNDGGSFEKRIIAMQEEVS